jgi:hypothetical protein
VQKPVESCTAKNPHPDLGKNDHPSGCHALQTKTSATSIFFLLFLRARTSLNHEKATTDKLQLQ